MPSKEAQAATNKIRATEGNSIYLDLRKALSEEDDAKCIAEAIKEARVPLKLNLDWNKIGEEGAKFLSEGIKEARFPLTLDLMSNNIGATGAKFLSEGIKAARVPLKLNLNWNKIGEEGAKFLSEGIKEARFPLTLDLMSNNIGATGAKFLSEGIKEARVPLTLYLGYNAIGDAGAKFLSEGIKEARVPLTLHLTSNGIGDAGAKFLSEGIKEARVPLTLDLRNNYMGKAEAKFLSEARDDNFIIEARENPVVFLSRIKFRPSMRMLGLASYLPSVLSKLVQGYIGDEDLAWIEVAAIRAVDGASRNNKYASIDYDLLTSVYATSAVASEFEEKEDDGQEARREAPVVISAGQNQERADVFKGQGSLGSTDNSYPEYYNVGIDLVLELRLAGLTNAVVLKSQYFGEEFGKVVSRLASDASSILSGGTVQTVLAPVNLYNKHWLGLLFKGFGDRVEVTYMDSEQATILPGLRSELENGLSLNGYESQIEEARLTPQSYNNCGYEVIENFIYYLTGARATQEGAKYVHSLIVENSLLDPEVYGLKIEENAKLIGFLSNAEPVAINEITLFAEQVGETKQERAVPKDDSIAKLKTDLHRASVLFKTLDFAVDSARLVQEPSLPAFKKLVLDYAYLQGMVSGVNGYSIMISGAETIYQLQLGEYQQAFNIASSTISAMALPVILAMANRPYLGLAYGAWMTASTAYGAITNAYSFALELSDNDATLRSAIAYKDLAVTLAASPLQELYDFEGKVKECKLQINNLLFDKEKAIVEAQMKEHVEFGRKVFDYIHLPSLVENYGLMSDVIRGILTEEEAQDLQANHITIMSKQQSYEHCMELGSEGTKSSSEYYCYNLSDQVLDHVDLTAEGDIVIIEHL